MARTRTKESSKVSVSIYDTYKDYAYWIEYHQIKGTDPVWVINRLIELLQRDVAEQTAVEERIKNGNVQDS